MFEKKNRWGPGLHYYPQSIGAKQIQDGENYGES